MKIAIVNDVAMIAEALRRLVLATQEHEVLWVAHSGAQAVQFCAQHRPDLILMDLVMPGIDGVETTRQIMQQDPCAILVVTASPDDNTNLVFRALGAGALDVVATPVLAGRMGADSALLTKIRTIAKLVKSDAPSPARKFRPSRETPPLAERTSVDSLVAFGASTGGPAALAKIFEAWTPPANCAVVVVQHIDQTFAESFASWLSDQIRFPVNVIGEGMAVQGGQILLAKTNDHLVLDPEHRLRYSAAPAAYPYRPSVDVFFHCISRNWRRKAIGVLLTGMGRDGGRGLLAMRTSGNLTIAQDKASSAVYGMPRAAAELSAAELIAPLDSIAALLSKRL